MGSTYNAKYRLTFINGRWRKRYKGQQKYFPYGRSGYQRALEEARQWMAEIDAQSVPTVDLTHLPEYERLISHWIAVTRRWLDMAVETGDATFVIDARISANITDHLRRLTDPPRHLPDPAPFDFDPHDNIPSGSRSTWERFGGSGLSAVATPELTIAANVERFLASKRAKLAANMVSVDRVDSLTRYLNDFAGFAGGSNAIRSVNAATLAGYHDDLLRKIGEGSIRASTAHQYLVAVKQFLRFTWRAGALPSLPLNIDGDDLRISCPLAEIKVFSVGDVRRLLAELETRPKLKLYVLLMLNCGFNQIDIANLRSNEVDFERGRIKRKRSKTRSRANTPTVDYLLWEPTLKLLRQFASQGEFVLLNANGEQLVRKAFVNGKRRKNDNVRDELAPLMRKLGLSTQLKMLRKTAPTMLENHDIYGRYAPHFLGHSPKGITARHYQAPSRERFDEAVAWLGEQFLPTAK